MHIPQKSYPSVARIERDLNVDEDTAKRIRGLMDGSVDPFTSEAVQSLDRQSFNPHSKVRLILEAIDEAYETCGIESLCRESDQALFASYCNTGHSYAATILYCHRRGRFMLTDYATYVTSNSL